MLEVIDIAGVVSILANIDGSVDSHPRFRFVGCVDLVALEVPRENLRVCLVIKSKLEIGIDSQRIHRAHREARESDVFVDGQVHTIPGRRSRIDVRDRAVAIQRAASGKRCRSGRNGTESARCKEVVCRRASSSAGIVNGARVRRDVIRLLVVIDRPAKISGIRNHPVSVEVSDSSSDSLGEIGYLYGDRVITNTGYFEVSDLTKRIVFDWIFWPI